MHDLNALPLAERKRLMTATAGDGVFRVAVTRHPLQRLISAFKSKYSCDHVLKSPDSTRPDLHAQSDSSATTNNYINDGGSKTVSSRDSTSITSSELEEAQKEDNINTAQRRSATTAKSTRAERGRARHTAEREGVVTRLRRDANISESTITSSAPCMTMPEFAGLLDAIRRNVGRWGYTPGLHYLENHIRPQRYFLDVVDFEVVLDIRQWRDYAGATFAGRLPHAEKFAEMVGKEVVKSHHTEHLRVEIDDRTAVKLADFAALSTYGRLTYEMRE